MDSRVSYDEDLEQAQTLPEWIACSRAIATGEVVKVVGADSPQVTVTMRVSHWIRPSHGKSTLVFSERNPKIDGGGAWKTGGPVLAVIPLKTSDSARMYRGNQLTVNKRLITSGLKEASRTTCPSPWAASSR